MSYASLRKGRWSARGQIYMVTTVTAQRQPLLADFHCARLVIAEMRSLVEAGYVDSLTWVIMPDHLHWLFVLNDGVSLSGCMKRFKACSARAVNGYLQRQGALWQKSFHDHALRYEDDVRDMARYIVANPLRAGLCRTVHEYPHWDAVWL